MIESSAMLRICFITRFIFINPIDVCSKYQFIDKGTESHELATLMRRIVVVIGTETRWA